MLFEITDFPVDLVILHTFLACQWPGLPSDHFSESRAPAKHLDRYC